MKKGGIIASEKKRKIPLKEQTMKQTCSLIDTEFKREVVKILKELRLHINESRADMNSNAEYFRKELENVRKNQEK